VNPLNTCSACNQPVFETLETYSGTGDSRVDGTAKRIGNPVDGAVLLTLGLANGSKTCITVHGECASLDGERMFRMWRNLCEQMGAFSDESYRTAKGGKPISEEQQAAVDHSLCIFVSNPPVGILCAQPWQEIIDGRTASRTY